MASVSEPPAVGQPAPLFSLTSVQGGPVELAAYRGRRNVVVWFSRGFTCPFCRVYMDGMREGYELLTAHCDAGARESCVPIRVTGDPHDEEAWGFRARPAADALWREAEVFYAVGNQARCDEVRASLGTPTEACWGPVYFRRQ